MQHTMNEEYMPFCPTGLSSDPCKKGTMSYPNCWITPPLVGLSAPSSPDTLTKAAASPPCEPLTRLSTRTKQIKKHCQRRRKKPSAPFRPDPPSLRSTALTRCARWQQYCSPGVPVAAAGATPPPPPTAQLYDSPNAPAKCSGVPASQESLQLSAVELLGSLSTG